MSLFIADKSLLSIVCVCFCNMPTATRVIERESYIESLFSILLLLQLSTISFFYIYSCSYLVYSYFKSEKLHQERNCVLEKKKINLQNYFFDCCKRCFLEVSRQNEFYLRNWKCVLTENRKHFVFNINNNTRMFDILLFLLAFFKIVFETVSFFLFFMNAKKYCFLKDSHK